MITLLFWVLVIGILAYCVYAFPIPSPFKQVAIAILCLILLVVLFSVFAPGAVHVPLR